jgi:hypothetical protein
MQIKANELVSRHQSWRSHGGVIQQNWYIFYFSQITIRLRSTTMAQQRAGLLLVRPRVGGFLLGLAYSPQR